MSKMCPEWYTQRPHVGIPKLCSRETHSLHEANLCPQQLRKNKPDLLKEYTLFNSPALLVRKLLPLNGSSAEGPEHPEPFDERSARMSSSAEAPGHPEPFDERSARMSSSAEAPGHPEPFDERSARMKCDWRASFELTAGPAANFFSAPKCLKIPIPEGNARI